MKKILFMLFITLLCINSVSAKEDYEYFYYNEERVEDMWITRKNDTFIRSANPYIVKRKSDNKYVYCIEPFSMVQDNTPYKVDNDYTKYGITDEMMNRISLIMYYGYGYINHTDKKWYGITQYMIWKTINTKDTFYFSKVQNGIKEDLYKDEINEIEYLIKEHNKLPSFKNGYTISSNSKLTINSNIDLNNYEIITDIEYKIEDNNIIVENLEVGEYNIYLRGKQTRYSNDLLMYYSNNSQNVVIPGITSNLTKEYNIDIKVIEGNLELNKYNSITKDKLEGATYGIYKDNILIDKVVTNNKGNGNIKLPFGTYVVKELVAPKGYKLDDRTYTFTIDENNLEVKLELLDDKIVVKVPNTGLKKNYIPYLLLIVGLVGLIYEKKKYNLY